MHGVGRMRVGWRVAGVLLGVTALLIAYYWVHKPLQPGQAIAIGGALLDALSVSLLAAAAGGIGRATLRRTGHWIESGALSRAERLALEGTAGLGLVALGALAIGMAGGFRAEVLWGALAIGAGIAFRDVRGWLRDAAQILRHAARSLNTPWLRFLGGTAAILIGMALLLAFAPPTAWDALSYHLVGPAAYLETGRIDPHPENFFLGFPQGVELLFGLTMSLFGRASAAAPVHSLFGLLALLAVGGFAARRLSAPAGWLAVPLLLSAYSVWLLYGWPYVDLALMAYGACALVAIVTWRETDRRGWLALAGMYAGFALGAKYVAGGLLVTLALYVAISRRLTPRRAIADEALLIGMAALIFLPWAVKGLALYGNPIYPFIFDGLNWDAERTRIFSTSEQGLIAGGNAWHLAVLPLAATVFGVERTGTGYFFTLGPWLLTAPLLLIPGWRWLDVSARWLAAILAWLGAGLLLFWIALAALSPIGSQTRLVLVGMPVAALAGALGLHGLTRWPRRPLDIAFVVRALLVVTLLLSALESARKTLETGALSYFMLPSSGEASYLEANLGAHIVAMQRLDELPAGSRVRLMWEPRGFYCPARVTCLPDVVLDHWVHPLRLGRSPDAVFASWRAQGDAYLLIFEPGYRFYMEEDPRFGEEMAAFRPALERWMAPVWVLADGYTLYAWREEDV
jgi:hypothetical protein